MKKISPNEQIKIPAIRGTVLGVDVLRGYARLCDLSAVSRADIYDQKTNPSGTQRDLSPKHAREAYEYIRNKDLAFWPEVFLAARMPEVIEFVPAKGNAEYGTLHINTTEVSGDAIAISRVDGNHRLHYADGTQPGFPAIEKQVSFCIALGLTLEQEISLFRDINDNQRRMNTSHLDNIEARLTPEERLKRLEPDLYIARRLGRDADSPLFQMVYEGGAKVAGATIPLRTLRTGIGYMLSRPTKLTALEDADAQLRVIKHYFAAVKRWRPEAWNDPQKYVILRGAGLWAICFIGADVIDRALTNGRFRADDMLKILKSGREWDWSNRGDFQGFSGRGGAVRISNTVTAELQDASGVSVKELFRQIMDD